MTAAHEHDDVHDLVDRLTPDQVDEIRAHATRLVSGHQAYVPWQEAQQAAARLPGVDYQQFRTDVDNVIDERQLLGNGR